MSLVHQGMTLTIRPKGDSGCPTVCVATKPNAEIRTFHVSSKAFDIFCSVYLLKPTNIMHAPQFLKYFFLVGIMLWYDKESVDIKYNFYFIYLLQYEKQYIFLST